MLTNQPNNEILGPRLINNYEFCMCINNSHTKPNWEGNKIYIETNLNRKVSRNMYDYVFSIKHIPNLENIKS